MDIKIPFVITCKVTGLQKVYTSREFVTRKAENYGGLDQMIARYVCRDAKKMLKEGKSVTEVIDALKGTTDPVAVQALIDANELDLVKKVKVKKKVEVVAEIKDEVPTTEVPVTEEVSTENTADEPVITVETSEQPAEPDVEVRAPKKAKSKKSKKKVAEIPTENATEEQTANA